ncbi:MAG TPA: VanZ family protein [Gemmataceae bacterium]|nr:VanZ family protein [Gemmataceae bacterium]
MARRTIRLVHVLVFAAFLIAWTIALLSPVPHQSAERVLGSPLSVFIFGKGLHIAAYAYLTVLGGTVALFGRKWWWIVPGLVAHGCLTEFFQKFVGRTSRLEDVGLDTIGIVLGALVVLGWRRLKRDRSAGETASPG